MHVTTPMLVQYIVGLCCLRAHPDAVDVVLGDLVHDSAAGKHRDVDVTVTLAREDRSVLAFMAYEVKREAPLLDVTVVEQLIAKLKDMPTVTHRGIVSASGYTNGAVAKAKAHSVELYVFGPWTVPPGSRMPRFASGELPANIRNWERHSIAWSEYQVFLNASGGPREFSWTPDQTLFDENGHSHGMFANVGQFVAALLDNSSRLLVDLMDRRQLVASLSSGPLQLGEIDHVPIGTHTHTLDVRRLNANLRFESEFARLEWASISGKLEWQRTLLLPQFFVVSRLSDNEPFAGAAIAAYDTEGYTMCALTFAPHSREVGIHPKVNLGKNHMNAIRQLNILNRHHGDV